MAHTLLGCYEASHPSKAVYAESEMFGLILLRDRLQEVPWRVQVNAGF